MSGRNPLDFNPITAAMYDKQLLETVLKLAPFTALAIFLQELVIQLGLGMHFIQFLLSMVCVAIWNAIMMRNTHPRAASLLEQAGMGLVFFAFNMLLASADPKVLVWSPVLCFGFFILSFVMAALPRLAAA